MIITPQQYPTLEREIGGTPTDFMAGDEIDINGTRFPVVRRIFNSSGAITKIIVAKTWVRMSVQNDFIDDLEVAILEKDSEKLERVAKKIFSRVNSDLVSLYGFSDSRQNTTDTCINCEKALNEQNTCDECNKDMSDYTVTT